MSFTPYLIQPFQNTHENIFFRKVVSELKLQYENREEKSVLIGNLSCGGHLLDAIFISRGKIIIIDFKDYEGRLEFSENNPWKIYRGNDFVFVSGGGGIRNPYQQLNAYRFSLMNILTAKQEKILSPNHLGVRWDHINCMVLFHKNIQFNVETIQDKIKRFFTISDQNNYLAALQDRFSNNIVLNDNEIENFLKELDIRPENSYDEYNQPQIPADNYNNHEGDRLDFVKRHIGEVKGLNEEQKIIEYYRTLLTLEKFKDSETGILYRYNVNIDFASESFTLDLTANQNFLTEYLQNGQQQFPQNIFIGLNVISDNEDLLLFHTIILRADIDNPENVILKFSDFGIYSKILEDRGLSEDILEDLVTSMNDCESFLDKIEMIRNKLEWEIQIADHISVGLSNESPFNAQLISELKSIIRHNDGQGHSLFNCFLKNEKINEQVEEFIFDPAIFITESNYSQRKSVRLAFNQPLTLITGPPGTGKTQVVLNIMANAIANNKTILFASKNNKAVDNVKNKFQSLINNSDYILRFGTKSEVRERSKPIIQRFINLIHQRQIEDHNNEYEAAKHRCNLLYKNALSISDQLLMIPKLEKTVRENKIKYEQSYVKYNKWISSLEKNIKEIFVDKRLELNISKNDIAFYIQKFKQLRQYSITRFYFNIFLKNKYYLLLKNILNNQHHDIKNYIEKKVLILNPNMTALTSYLEYLEFVLEFKNLSSKVIDDYDLYSNTLNSELEILTKNEQLLIEYKSKENQLRNEFARIINETPSAGKEFINVLINQKLLNADISTLQQYSDYIPDNIPWQQQNIPQFTYTVQNFLNNFNAFIVTNLSVKNAFPLANQLFDLVVVDEASQCDVASALPLIYRAKKFVVIGDPLQLTHITNIKEYEEKYVLEKFNLEDKNFNYVENSLYKYCESLSLRSKFETIFLNEHFRSHPDIISFSNNNFYLPKLGQELIVKTKPEMFGCEPKGITWKNVNGQLHHIRNENIAEVGVCINLALQFSTQFPNASIGITTPYKHQAEAIRNILPQNLQNRVIADTVHKFQGDERDIMILSLVLCSGSPLKKANWINYQVPYLLNVAVTRARSSLIIVGDFEYCKRLIQRGPSPLSQLANYVYSLNRVIDL